MYKLDIFDDLEISLVFNVVNIMSTMKTLKKKR